MKVHELQTILSKVPPHADVLLYDEESDILPILEVTLNRSEAENFRDRVPPGTTEDFILIT